MNFHFHGYMKMYFSVKRINPQTIFGLNYHLSFFVWCIPAVEQELLTLPEHLSSPPIFSGVRVTRSLVLYVCFGDRCLSFCTFSFGHCVVCSSSIYGFWLPLWYLQTLLTSWKFPPTNLQTYINIITMTIYELSQFDSCYL